MLHNKPAPPLQTQWLKKKHRSRCSRLCTAAEPQLGGCASHVIGFKSSPHVFILSPGSRKSGKFFSWVCHCSRGCTQLSLLMPHPLPSRWPKQITWPSPTPWGKNILQSMVEMGGRVNICFAIIQIIIWLSSSMLWFTISKELQMDCPRPISLLLGCPHITQSGAVGAFLLESFASTP